MKRHLDTPSGRAELVSAAATEAALVLAELSAEFPAFDVSVVEMLLEDQGCDVVDVRYSLRVCLSHSNTCLCTCSNTQTLVRIIFWVFDPLSHTPTYCCYYIEGGCSPSEVPELHGA